MREDVADDAGLTIPARPTPDAGRLLQGGLVVLHFEPVRGRYFGHAAEQAFFGAGADQERIAARDHESRPSAQRPGFLRRLARKGLLIAARTAHTVSVQRTQSAGRFLRGTDRGAKVNSGCALSAAREVPRSG